MSQYAKAIVAVIGVGITTLLGLIPPDTTLWTVLTVVSAMLTAVGVYLVPNAPGDDAYQPRHAADQIPGTTIPLTGEQWTGEGPGGGG